MTSIIRTTAIITVAVVATTMVRPLHAQTPAPMKEASPGLLKQAKIMPDSARALAQSKVPDGTIESAEIEREHNKLLYSFDIRRTGKTGIDEVQVDALTGKVLGVDHESPAAERAEAKMDKKQMKKTASPHR